MKLTSLILSSAALLFVGACGSDNAETVNTPATTEVSTDIIQNPNTAQEAVDPATMPVIAFENNVHDFGTIKQGDKVEHNFKFTNTGQSDLIIQNARASCGCTVPTFPKEAIAPGQTGFIPVVFDSKGKSGNQTKTITITGNTNPNNTILTIKTFIES